jgi:selenide, water dikinase
LGHLVEMLTASDAEARLDPAAVPALDGALALLRTGLTSSLHGSNAAALAALAPDAADSDSALTALLIDPQTAGGLLAGVPADRAAACLDELHRLGYRAAEIGVVAARGRGRPLVSLDAGAARQEPASVRATAAG